jgi:transcriptional regulator with XRE-family HTH domain
MTSPRDALASNRTMLASDAAEPTVGDDPACLETLWLPDDRECVLVPEPAGRPPARVQRLSRAVPRLRAHLGQRVRALRHAQQLSQAALGRAAKLSVKFVRRIEEGRAAISLDDLYSVAEALQVPLSALMQIDLDRPLPRAARASRPASDRAAVALRSVPGAGAARRRDRSPRRA